MPSGNGTIGASVLGAVRDETIIINHADLWHGGVKDTLPDVSRTLPETRRLMSEGKYLEASWHLTRTLKETGYHTRLAAKLPLAEIRLSMPGEHAFRQYRRSVDMETGEVTVKWQAGDARYERNLFVSRAHDCIIYEIKAAGAFLNGRIGLAFRRSEQANKAEKLKELEETAECCAADGYSYFAAANDDGTDYGAVLRWIPLGGSPEISTSQDGSLRFEGCTKGLALVKVFVKGDRSKDWYRLKEELALLDPSYESHLAMHAELHGRLFSSVTLDLGGDRRDRSNEELLLEAYEGEAPTALVEKMWSFGRYLFISGTAPNAMPFGMYGLWAGDYRLVWCHNMANENVQMMYWHAAAGGLTELMPALFNYYGSMMDDFRECAMKLYGCRGIYIPAGSTPGIGLPNQIVPVIMNWTGAAGWLARHYYEYYVYTGDTDFLLETALPFMREAAQFYEDFAVLGDDGRYKLYPSVSPENTPLNFMPPNNEPLAHPMPTTINATMDIAILKELLTHLIEGSEAAGRYTVETKKWRSILERIPSYAVNSDGAVREWIHPAFEDRYEHRHISHLYPIFPGQEFTKEEEPELFEAFEIAVRKRVIGAQSGWSLAHMASVYARLGMGDQALESLDLLSRSCLLNNFVTLHNDWRNMGISMNRTDAPIQMDANMGFVHAVQEMLLYGSRDLVKLLPALPSKWVRGNVRGLRFCTGSVSMTWDRNAGTIEAVLSADRETDIRIGLPEWADRVLTAVPEGEGRLSPAGKGFYRLRLLPGQQCILRSEALSDALPDTWLASSP
ncbi:glycoside hydrolase N-terminal domain-containing protein [Paenibacillus filicis]|uniref:Glycoside hydrolase N-terminal domain-containing protein n=1 Tax=Paenibacillus gyeongsangnamensis TaxID=3388067 RepID=A0ABT4QAC4_9BACL|nr:glycoside hydrolase N-terminal domain-containing protein [Paenibacillus filicis]MCZ8513726.1 glycoside hydrolase N-terminal domain-containing protein [Paenibacillus filicis]